MDHRQVLGEPAPSTSSADENGGKSDNYELKKSLLEEKYNYVKESNNMLMNRVYHVKKEILYLQRLKRVLCQRLLVKKDDYTDAHLEIPDDDTQVREEPPKKKKKPVVQPREVISAEAKHASEEQMRQRMGPLIESIMSECKREQTSPAASRLVGGSSAATALQLLKQQNPPVFVGHPGAAVQVKLTQAQGTETHSVKQAAGASLDIASVQHQKQEQQEEKQQQKPEAEPERKLQPPAGSSSTSSSLAAAGTSTSSGIRPPSAVSVAVSLTSEVPAVSPETSGKPPKIPEEEKVKLSSSEGTVGTEGTSTSTGDDSAQVKCEGTPVKDTPNASGEEPKTTAEGSAPAPPSNRMSVEDLKILLSSLDGKEKEPVSGQSVGETSLVVDVAPRPTDQEVKTEMVSPAVSQTSQQALTRRRVSVTPKREQESPHPQQREEEQLQQEPQKEAMQQPEPQQRKSPRKARRSLLKEETPPSATTQEETSRKRLTLRLPLGKIKRERHLASTSGCTSPDKSESLPSSLEGTPSVSTSETPSRDRTSSPQPTKEVVEKEAKEDSSSSPPV